MIQIPKACYKKWNDLYGNDQVKYCALCKKKVHNLTQLSANQIQEIVKLERKVCGMIHLNQNHPQNFNFRKTMLVFGFLASNVFGQQDSIQISGIVNDVNGFPIMDSKIVLKDFPLESISNENGEFILNVPKNLKTYVLEVKDDKNKIEILYKEEELSHQLIIPLEHLEGIIIGEIIYKLTFKQRVINTITWPYRKICKTFFEN